MTAYPMHQPVVLSRDGVFYGNGYKHPLSSKLDIENLDAVLVGAGQIFRGTEGVCMVDIDLDTAARSFDKIHASWRRPTTLREWSTFTRPDGTVVHIGLMRRPADDNALGPLLVGHRGPADVAARLGQYQRLTGVPWRISAGVSACAALRQQFTDPRKQPIWHYKLPRGLRSAGPLVWRNPVQPSADSPASVHVFDINAMYLAALRIVKLAWSGLERPEQMLYDTELPGFWEVDLTYVPPELYNGKTQPPMFPAALGRTGTAWLSTPMVKYLWEVTGTVPEVLDAWVNTGQRLTRAYAERLIAARANHFGPVGDAGLALKRSYAELVGMFARPKGQISRPDWAAMVIDLARVNFLRRALRGNLLPGVSILAVQTDAVYYVCTDDKGRQELPGAIGIGTGPGTFKYVDTLTVAQYRKRMGVR